MDHIFIISFSVFLVLNLVENLIHYSIGRMKERNSYSIEVKIPSAHDMFKIIIIMLGFAILQGLLTWLFEKI